ncbi:MAG TPA: hypothetical protein VMU16_14030 [Candidatus Binataceae bacterium]|nr:hypothetical protein [Candidatus Binataceae bacterium]
MTKPVFSKLFPAVVIALSLASAAMAQNREDIPICEEGAVVKSGESSIPEMMKPGGVEAMSDDEHDPHISMSKGAMALHMQFTAPRSPSPGDRERAAKLVDTLKESLAKYKDYKVAEKDGYKPFHPEFKQMKVVHFTRFWYGLKSSFTFNPAEPTSLLYERTPDGGYRLIGAMYTDRKSATDEQLNERVPLSVARWHRHVNFCFPKRGTDLKTVDWTKFGIMGSIATKSACDAAGGRFYPQVFGWMVHVYPWESNPELVWAK